MEPKDTSIKQLIKTSSILSIFMLAFKVLGFIKQAVIANYYGASIDMDLYFMSSSFVRGIASVFIDALSISMISVYTFLLINKGRKKANCLLSGLFVILLIISILFVVLFWIFAPNIARILGYSYSDNLIQQLITDIRLVTPYIIFSSIVIVCMSALDAEKKFVIPRFESVINSGTIIIATVSFSKVYGVNTLFVADIISVAVFAIILLAAMRKNFHFEFYNYLENPYIINILKMALPLLIGNASYRLNTIVDSVLASVIEGGPASLSYSHVLEQFITITLATSIGNTTFSYLANYIAEKKQKMVTQTLVKMLHIITIIIIPVSIITIFYSHTIVEIVYFRGNFTQEAVILTASALIGYGVGFPFTATKDLLIKCLYAFGNTKIATINGVVSIIFNIVLSFILSQIWGLFGIAIATSFSSVLGFMLTLYFVNNNYVILLNKNNIHHLCKLIIASIIMIIFLVIFKQCYFTDISELLLGVVVGFLIYILTLYALKVDEIQKLYSIISKNFFIKK